MKVNIGLWYFTYIWVVLFYAMWCDATTRNYMSDTNRSSKSDVHDTSSKSDS